MQTAGGRILEAERIASASALRQEGAWLVLRTNKSVAERENDGVSDRNEAGEISGVHI